MNITHDINLDICTANSRKAKRWHNETASWSSILSRMEATTRTAETVAEYKRMSKDRQSEVKDVGAFVGGYCTEGSRSRVASRSILALDADFADPHLWDDWSFLCGTAAALYSTHKHTPEAPRFRLVVPLSRSVTPDEYQAIGRRIASLLGIDQFDDSTYQPQRCMFWPSTSRDGEYIFHYLDAAIMDPDDVLASYKDWKDISSWPMSSRVTEIVRKEATKQADPLEKPGIVGQFCRAYTIEEAIEAFIQVYEPCTEPHRYTYTEGSTGAGVTTYDGKFSYSFHATDPASGQLCNAWDLVRLHKFGAMDEDIDPAKPMTSRPSWGAMVRLAQEDDRVKALAVSATVADFDELPAEDGTPWTTALELNKDGTVKATIENAVVILDNAPEFRDHLLYDEFVHNITTTALPWRSAPGAWTDTDDAALRYYLEKTYHITGKDKIFDAVNVVAMRHKVHPVREYLDALAWDGLHRVDTLLVDYLGAEDTPYTRAVTRKTLAAAVARIYRPGCKFDYMLTLRGWQGIGKSTLFRKLGGAWFSDSFSTIQGKDSFEQLQGVWLMEVGELAGMRKAEAETIKLYISKQVDRFRPAYGRRSQEFPRQCVFIGTTNETQFLRDATGNRRFWVVDTPGKPTRSVWDDLTEEEVRQIWAEAVQVYMAGEDLYLTPALEREARAVQAAYEEDNPKLGLILSYLERGIPDGWEDMDLYTRKSWLDGKEKGTRQRETITAIEIYAECLGGNPERLDRMAMKDINDIMTQAEGWRRQGEARISTGLYGRQRFYRRVE